MEEQIKRIVAYTKISYVVFWLLPVSVVVAGECGSGWVGLCADNVQATYLAETLVILLTAGCVAYYLMLSNKSILCALIALTASLFCLPGEGRLRNELKINGDDL